MPRSPATSYKMCVFLRSGRKGSASIHSQLTAPAQNPFVKLPHLRSARPPQPFRAPKCPRGWTRHPGTALRPHSGPGPPFHGPGPAAGACAHARWRRRHVWPRQCPAASGSAGLGKVGLRSAALPRGFKNRVFSKEKGL